MTDMTMNSNLMFRSMFFMNDEATRHFLAPPLPPIQSGDIQSEYFQKKLISQGTNTPGLSQASTSANNTVNLSAASPITTPAQQPSQQQLLSPEKPPISLPKHRPHTCEECGKTFLMKHHLSTHMRVHTGERPHVCPECGKSFALKHCLSTHLLLHTAERPFKCPECNKSFTLKHHLVSHERVHTRERPFECPECGQRFPQKRHLSTHIKFHSGERPFSCNVCMESFSREEHLVMHSRFHGGLSPYNCPDCGAGFLRKFELVNHERQHGRNPESCPTCGKEFLQKRTLLVHVRTCGGMNINQQNPGQTPTHTQESSPSRFSEGTPPRFNDTQQRFNTSETSSPRYSESGNNGNNQFRFSEGQMRFNDGTSSPSPMSGAVTKDKVCKECGETFSSMEGLALHLRLHFGDHSFLADICSLAASLKQTAVNVAASLKKTHICVDCGRGFTQRHGLFQHRQKHPNGNCKEKPFACEKCGKSFAQKNHLTLHERQHMDLPRNNGKNKQQTNSEEQMDDQPIESSSGDSSQRSCQEDGVISNPMMMQNHEHQSMIRHDASADQRTERKDLNPLLLNHSERQRMEICASDNTNQTQDQKEIDLERMVNPMMHPRMEILNRHLTETQHNSVPVSLVRNVPQQSSMQTNSMIRHDASGDQRAESQDQKEMDLERMVNPMHPRMEILNRHLTETQHNSVPVALVRSVSRVPQQSSMQPNTNDRMLSHHHHLNAQNTTDQNIHGLHPVTSKQY